VNSIRQDVLTILHAAIAGADPGRLVERALSAVLPRHWSGILAAGKAAPRMVEGLIRADHRWRQDQSVMVIPEGVAGPAWALRADHPLPSSRNICAAQAVHRWACLQRDQGDVLALLSGGASALLTLPAPPLTLEDVRHVTASLLAAGASISQLNCVRKHIEQLKGGRLGVLLAPANVRVLVLSDVIGDDLSSIASGPFSPDSTTFSDALSIVRSLAPACGTVIDFLEAGSRGEHQETPKPGDPHLSRIRPAIIGSNANATAAAATEAARLGYRVLRIEHGITGEAASAGRSLASMARTAAEQGVRRACILFGGETTVTLGPVHGRGGRNQELALAAALQLEDLRHITVGAIGTDGVDGSTDAAGAIADSCLLRTVREQGLDPLEHLKRHDSHTLFSHARGLIRTGPTGTNVNDVAIALIS
jgi:glycerate 2-kinase